MGGVLNTGSIHSTNDYGLFVESNAEANGATFSGGVVNGGAIVSKATGIYVYDNGYSGNFVGGVTNSGAITVVSATDYGIYIDDNGYDGTFSGGVFNTGAITSGGTGLYVVDDGYSGNFTGGVINSGNINVSAASNAAIYVDDDAYYGTFSGGVTNTGNLVSSAGSGISVVDVGYSGAFVGNIVNSGHVQSLGTALYIDDVGFADFNGSVINSGSLLSNSTYGVYIDGVAGNLHVSNFGSITGKTGLYAGVNANSVTVYNDGSISGTGGTAVDFNAGINTLVDEVGSSIAGKVIGTGNDKLQLAGTGTGTFNMSNIGTQYTGFTGFYVASGFWQAGGTDSQTQSWALEGGTFDLTGGSSLHGGVAFTGPATLEMDSSPSQVLGNITGFATGDGIDLGYLPFNSAYSAVWTENGSNTGGTLNIMNGASTVTSLTNLTGSFTSANFALSQATNGTELIQHT